MCLKFWSPVAGVWEAVEASGGGTPLEEIGNWETSLDISSLILLPVLSWLLGL